MNSSSVSIHILIIIACIFALWSGASMLVDAAARIARRLGLSELIIGLTIVAMGTSAPEFAVSVTAALSGDPEISIGNVIGSNIFNLGFILGTVAMIHMIHTNKRVVYRDGGILIGVTLLLLFFMRDYTLQNWEGVVLFLLLLAYLGLLIYQRDLDEDEVPQGEFAWKDIPKLLIGLLLVVLGGQYLVGSAKIVASAAGLSPYVIGATVVAAATSAPEAVTSIVAIVRGMEQISLGNLIGSNIFNVLGVLGLAGALSHPPLEILSAAEFGSLVFLCVQMVLTALMLRNGWNLSRREGALLFVINLISWVVIVWAGRPMV